jgi:hypothetical protein
MKMLESATQLLALVALASSGLAYAVDGVSSDKIVIGQSITLQDGKKSDYGNAVQAGVQT